MDRSSARSLVTLALALVACGAGDDTDAQPTHTDPPIVGYEASEYAGACPFGEVSGETDAQRQFRQDFVAGIAALREAGGRCGERGQQPADFGPLGPAVVDVDLTFSLYCSLQGGQPQGDASAFQQRMVDALQAVGDDGEPLPAFMTVAMVDETRDGQTVAQELYDTGRSGMCTVVSTRGLERAGLAFGETWIVYGYSL